MWKETAMAWFKARSVYFSARPEKNYERRENSRCRGRNSLQLTSTELKVTELDQICQETKINSFTTSRKATGSIPDVIAFFRFT
jgi:hypothetical protein